jgi:hypothetical protein
MHDLHMTEEFSLREDWDKMPSGAPDQVPGVKRYWGKWPGVVVNPVDPEMRGRMLVQVADVWGPNISSWAHPCMPWGGVSLGMYVVPAIGANVWVEFMHGHPDLPIWTGFWWGSLADPPPSTKLTTPGVPQMAIESLLKHAVVISDSPIPGLLPMGGILLRSGDSFIAVEPSGIRVLAMKGVAINGIGPAAALFVT